MKSLAISYAQRGWSVFPLIPNSKKPITAHGLKDASRDTEQITKWWTDNPKANIGICAGKESGFVVVDIDVKNEAKGLESLKSLNLPPTLTAKTPSGGWHYFYAYHQGLTNRTNLYPGIDFKTDGGYVVAVGSVIDGNAYEWSDKDHPIESLPQVIIDAFKIQKIFQPVNEKEQIVLGGRNARLASMAGAMRRQGMTAEQMLPSLMAVNNQKCNPPLPDDEVILIAKSVSRYEPGGIVTDPSSEKKIEENLERTLNGIRIINKEFEGMGCGNDFYNKAKKTTPKFIEDLIQAGNNIDLKFQEYKQNGNFTIVEFALTQYRESWSKLVMAN